MKYTFEKAEKSIVILKMNFDLQEWNDALVVAYNKTKNKFNFPGWRKGHVPMNVIVKQYGKEVFYEEAFDVLYSKNYGEILDKEPSIEPISYPSLDFKDNGEKGITLICNIPVIPEVKLGAYTGLDFTKTIYEVTDEEIENEVKNLAERNSREIPVTDREAKNGDITTIDYSGSINGKKFDGGTAEKQRLELGSNTFIPGFEDGVCGMKIGEEKDINVKFPENYGSDELSGKDAVFHIKLHEIAIKEIPEVTDDFIKDATGEESLEVYKKNTRIKFENQKKDRSDRELEDAMLKAIVDQSEVEIPEALISREQDNMLKDYEYRLMYSGYTLDAYLKATNQTKDSLKEIFKPEALNRVKSQLVYSELVKELDLKATDEEMEKGIEKRAKDYSKGVEEFKKTVTDDMKAGIENEIIFDKVNEYLKANNKIKEVKEADLSEEKPTDKKTTAKKSEAKAEGEKPAAKKTTAKKAEAKEEGEKPAAKKTTTKKTETKAEGEKTAKKSTSTGTKKTTAKKAE